MSIDNETYDSSPSTTFAWKRVKMPATRRRPNVTASQSPSRPALARWDGREPLTVLVTYRGGAEAWYEVKARGRTYRFPGVTALHDALERIYG